MPDLTAILGRVRELPEADKLGSLDSEVDKLIGFLSLKIAERGNSIPLYAYKAAIHDFSTGYSSGLDGRPAPDSQNPEIRWGHEAGLAHHKLKEDAELKQENTRATHIEMVSQQIKGVLDGLYSEIGMLIEAQQRPFEFLLLQIRANNKGHSEISDGLAAVLSHYEDWTTLILNNGVVEKYRQVLEGVDTFDSNIRLGILHLFTKGPGEAQHRLNLASNQAVDQQLLESLHHVRGNPYPAQLMLKPGYDRIKFAGQFGKTELVSM